MDIVGGGRSDLTGAVVCSEFDSKNMPNYLEHYTRLLHLAGNATSVPNCKAGQLKKADILCSQSVKLLTNLCCYLLSAGTYR